MICCELFYAFIYYFYLQKARGSVAARHLKGRDKQSAQSDGRAIKYHKRTLFTRF